MLAISISDTSVEFIKISRSLLRGFFVSHFSRREFPQGLKENKLAEILKEILPPDQKCALALPDTKTIICRFKIPPDVSGAALKTAVFVKAKELISGNIEDLVYIYKIKDSQVFFLATRHETLDKYLTIFKSFNINPIFVTSEAQTLWETFRHTLDEDKTVMFVDLGQETGKLSFFDQIGPVPTLKRKVKRKVPTKDLKKEVEKAKRAFEEKEGKEINRAILADVKGGFRNDRCFSKALGIWTIDLNKILETRIKGSRTKYHFGRLPLVSFAKAIGLNLLVERKGSLNLLKPSVATSQNKVKQFIVTLNRMMTQIAKRLKGKRVKLLLIIFGAWLILLGAILAFRGFPEKRIPSTQEAIPSPTIQPSSTPTLKREDLKIKVLNGSGERRIAGTTAKFLEGKGYQEIKIGNADRFDYEETLIQIKEEKQSYLDLITEDLKDNYTVATAAAWLEKEEEFDVIIIVGRE